MMSATSMMINAIASLRERVAEGASDFAARCMSGTPSEQAGRSDQQYDCHDDEDHGVRCFGKEDLGQALDHPQAEAGDDRPHDRAHPADHYHRENHDDEIGAHLWTDIVDG